MTSAITAINPTGRTHETRSCIICEGSGSFLQELKSRPRYSLQQHGGPFLKIIEGDNKRGKKGISIHRVKKKKKQYEVKKRTRLLSPIIYLMAITCSLSFLAEWSHLKVDDPPVRPKCHSNSKQARMDLKRLSSFLLSGGIGGFGHKRERANDTDRRTKNSPPLRLSPADRTFRISRRDFTLSYSRMLTRGGYIEPGVGDRPLHHCRGPSNRLRLSPPRRLGEGEEVISS